MSHFHDRHATFCVGVGASAGGLEALVGLFSRAQPDGNLCYLVVMHLSPDHPSRLVEFLRKDTALAVEAASDGLVPRADTIYVVEPNTTLSCDGRKVRVEPYPQQRYLHRPIDALFESMSKHWDSRCAAVVLSGTGTDGSRGARAVKESGGFIIAQHPGSAAFDGMPNAVIGTGQVDLVLEATQIAEELRELRATGVGETTSDTAVGTAAEFSRILETLHQGGRVDFSLYKPASIARRIERRRGIVRTRSLLEYAELLERDEEEVRRLSDELLIGVTQFFREPAAIREFSAALTAFVQSRSQEPLRIWVAGCSTGEEAYTVAIVVSEVLRDCGRPLDFKLFATDVNEASLAIASAGHYTATAAADLPPDLLPTYFEPDPTGGYLVAGFLRERILFARHDLLNDPPFSNLDVITCRNVFIYLLPEAQARVSRVFGFGLRRAGLLWMGTSESPKDGDYRYEPLSQKGHVFRATKDTSATGGPLPVGEPRKRMALPVPSLRQGTHARHLVDGALFVELASDLLPPHVIFDENYTLIFHSGGARRYFEFEDGPASLDIRRILPRHFKTLLMSAIDKQKAGEEADVLFTGLEVPSPHRDAPPASVSMRVRRLRRLPAHESLTVVFFESEVVEPPTRIVAVAPTDDTIQARIDGLEDELSRTRSQLQTTIWKLEVSNEEAKSTNEQLLASNEELQSVNEELQSVNEELHTVNVELQTKVEELWRVTSEMDEVLATVDMGIIVLDEDLRIRRFNQRAAAFVRVVAYDAGRPFSHLSNSFSGTPLLDDCARAAREREQLERLLFSDDGAKVLFRAKPMSPSVNRGILLSFSDISSLESLEDTAHRLREAVEQLDSPVVLLDTTGMITYANRCFAELARRDPGFLAGTAFADLLPGDDRVAFEQAFRDVMGNQPWRGTSTLEIPGAASIEEEVQLRPLMSKTGQVIGAARFSASLASVGRKIRVLLIEDDPVDVDLLEARLTRDGLLDRIQAHGSAESALDELTSAAEDGLPDLILLDLGLPGMSGEEFLKAMHRVPRLARIPTVILTGSQDTHRMLEAYQLGASAYIVKPIDQDDFRKVLARLDDFWFSIIRYPNAAGRTPR